MGPGEAKETTLGYRCLILSAVRPDQEEIVGLDAGEGLAPIHIGEFAALVQPVQHLVDFSRAQRGQDAAVERTRWRAFLRS